MPTRGVPQDPAVVSQFLLGLIAWLDGDEAEGERLCTEARRAANALESDRAAFRGR